MSTAFTISVTDVDKTGNAKDVQFRMDYRTTLAQFTKEPAQANILRRTSDLQWLVQQLGTSYPECIVPPIPAALSLKSPVPVATGYSAIPSAQVDERVKEVVQLFLMQIVAHPTFVTSSCVQQFFESGNQFVPYTVKQSSSMSKFLKTVTKSVRSVKEIDPWFDDRKTEVLELRSCVDRCNKALEKMCKADRALGQSYADLATKLLDFGTAEPNVTLAGGVRKFAAAFQKSAMAYSSVGEMESLYTNDVLVQHGQACANAETTLENRLDALQEYENACKISQKKKQAADKLKASSQIKVDKVDAALNDLAEARQVEKDCKEFVSKISDAVQSTEWPLFVKLNENTLISSLVNHVRIRLASERQQAREYDAIIADLAKGGRRSGTATPTTTAANTVVQQDKIAVDVL